MTDLIGPGPAYSAPLNRDPTAADGVSAGYAVFSAVVNTTTLEAFVCLDNTDGAARWISLTNPLGIKFRSGFRVPIYGGTCVTTGASLAVDTIYAVRAAVVPIKLLIAGLEARVVTGGAGSAMKTAIYADSAGRPYGAPLVADNTGVATTASNAAALSALTGAVYPQVPWFCLKITGTCPATVSIAGDYAVQQLTGRAASNGNTAVTGISTPHAYATAWPTLTGGETWTEVLGNVGIPNLCIVPA